MFCFFKGVKGTECIKYKSECKEDSDFPVIRRE